jgi:mitochondrial division protein 1
MGEEPHGGSSSSNPSNSNHYPSAMTSLTRQMQRRPGLQRSVFSFVQTSPRDLVRSNLSTSEISHRAMSYLSDDLLANVPTRDAADDDNNASYSLFQGFQATLPDSGESEHRKSHRRRTSKQKLLAGAKGQTGGDGDGGDVDASPASLGSLKRDRNAMNHRLEMMAIRKNLCSTEIHEIDGKLLNLTSMRKIVLERLASLESDEVQLEHERESCFPPNGTIAS